MTTEGTIRTEAHDHILKIIIDNPAKKNSFSPLMMDLLSDALTELHNNDSYWVGVICAEGKDFTAVLFPQAEAATRSTTNRASPGVFRPMSLPVIGWTPPSWAPLPRESDNKGLFSPEYRARG